MSVECVERMMLKSSEDLFFEHCYFLCGQHFCVYRMLPNVALKWTDDLCIEAQQQLTFLKHVLQLLFILILFCSFGSQMEIFFGGVQQNTTQRLNNYYPLCNRWLFALTANKHLQPSWKNSWYSNLLHHYACFPWLFDKFQSPNICHWLAFLERDPSLITAQLCAGKY